MDRSEIPGARCGVEAVATPVVGRAAAGLSHERRGKDVPTLLVVSVGLMYTPRLVDTGSAPEANALEYAQIGTDGTRTSR
jgi:hypothetical protein